MLGHAAYRIYLTLLGVTSAWLVVFTLSDFNWAVMFVPWTHDDFEVFEGFTGFDVRAVRPIATNFELFFGQFGEVAYYSIISLLIISLLTITIQFAITLFELEISNTALFLFSAATASVFFSTTYANIVFQYLGLETNLLSYIFGMLAAIVLLRRGGSLWSLLLAFLLVMLAAFSKEDLAAFLGVVVLARLAREWARGANRRSLVISAACHFGVVGLPYALSVTHSLVLGSPFLSNQGTYTLSGPLEHISRNLVFYVTSSRCILGVFALLLASVLLLLLASPLVASLRRYRAASLSSVAAVAALLLPYLLLPRSYGYYTVSFVPLAIAALLALGLTLFRTLAPGHGPIARVSLGLLVLGVIIGPFALDYQARIYQMEWHEEIRQSIDTQYQQIARANTLGLQSCNAIRVSGLSNILSPFMTWYAGYINHRFHIKGQWLIETEPKTRLDGFGKPHPSPTDPIRFITAEELAKNTGSSTHDCELAFNPETLQATFRKLDVPLAPVILAFGPATIKAVPNGGNPDQPVSLWIKAWPVSPSVVVLWNDTPLVSMKTPEAKIISAQVPNDLLAAPGIAHLTLRDIATNLASIPVDIKILP